MATKTSRREVIGALDPVDGLDGIAEMGGKVSIWTRTAGRFDGALDDIGSELVTLQIGTRWVRIRRDEVVASAWESGECARGEG